MSSVVKTSNSDNLELSPLNRSKAVPIATIFGDSIAGSSPRSLLNASFEPNTTGLANFSYAVACQGFAICGVRAQGSSRLLIGDPGSAPHLQEQINQFLTARAVSGGMDSKVQVAFVKSLTNSINGAAALSQAQVNTIVDTYKTQTDRLLAAGVQVVHVVPSLRADESAGNNLLSYNSLSQCRDRMYALFGDNMIDLWEVMQRRSSAHGGAPTIPQTWNTGFTSDNFHPNLGGAGVAFDRACQNAVSKLSIPGNLVVPYESGTGFLNSINDHSLPVGASYTFPVGGGVNWNRSGAADPTCTVLAPDSEGVAGTEVSFTGGSYVNFVLTGLLVPGQWYAFTCTHRITTANTTGAQFGLRMNWSGNSSRTSLFESVYYASPGWKRATVLFECPGVADGFGNPSIQFGNLNTAETCTVQVREIQLTPVTP